MFFIMWCFSVAGDAIPTVLVTMGARKNTLDLLLENNVSFPVINCQPGSVNGEAKDVRSSLYLPSGVHDDVIKWGHFPRYWSFVRGINRWPVNSPHKGQWHGALMFSLICTWTNGWVNNRDAGDLRHHCTHLDVIVMGLNSLKPGIILDIGSANERRRYYVTHSVIGRAHTHPIS